MNMLKRITAFALVFVLMLGMATTALAADPGKGKGNQKQIEKTHQVAVDKKAAKEHGFWAVFIGKITGQPVYKLLGGGREKLHAFISTLGCDVDDMDKVREWGFKVRDMNVYGQKWFFKYN
jgi:L-alanine-DL-glutamate epimerase-like enolase superfamily enzyme